MGCSHIRCWGTGHYQKQHGAVEARRAHNPEGPRSKRGVAISRSSNPPPDLFFFSSWNVYCGKNIGLGLKFRVTILPHTIGKSGATCEKPSQRVPLTHTALMVTRPHALGGVLIWIGIASRCMYTYIYSESPDCLPREYLQGSLPQIYTNNLQPIVLFYFTSSVSSY